MRFDQVKQDHFLSLVIYFNIMPDALKFRSKHSAVLLCTVFTMKFNASDVTILKFRFSERITKIEFSSLRFDVNTII